MVALGLERNARSVARRLAAGDIQHRSGEIDPCDVSVRKAPGELDEVSSGTTTDLENAERCGHRGAGHLQDGTAAEEKRPAGRIINRGMQRVVFLQRTCRIRDGVAV